jgi:hypothetical protein
MNEDLILTTPIVGTMDRPKSLDPNDRAGTEDIRPDEVQLPRLAIAQGLSPQLVPGEGKYIRGLTIGEMFNDVTEAIYGNGPLTVVPVLRHVTRIEFDPNDKKVPLDRNVPPGDPRLQWEGNNPPRATEFVEFISILLRPGVVPEAVVVSIKTTNKQQRAAAKLWTTYIVQRQAPIYSGLYTISSKIEKGKNKKGEDTMYGVFVVKNTGFIPTDTPGGAALFQHCLRFHESLQGKTIVIERDAVDDEANTVAGTVVDGDTSFDPSSM